MYFLMNSPTHILAKMHDYITILSLYDAFIHIKGVLASHNLALKNVATQLVVLNFWRCV